MRRVVLLLLLTVPSLGAATAPSADPVAAAARDAAAATAQARRLEAEASAAGDEAAQLRAEQRASVAAIEAAEARISAADLRAAALDAALADRARSLAERQRPAAALLAGLAQMSRRPPLLALADHGSIDDLVHVRGLLAATVPVIEARTAALRRDIDTLAALRASADAARAELAAGRTELARQQQRLAGLERQADARALASGAAALGAGDVALSSGDRADQLAGDASAERSARRLAGQLATLADAPPRPGPALAAPSPPLAYRLPLDAPLEAGLGEVSASGIRSRGLGFANTRGATITVPAEGRIAFAGPFRRYAGVVIIDHGGGWLTLLTNVATSRAVGDTVRLGEPLGRATGPVGLELSRRGQPQPAALIAGSSSLLSNSRKSG